MLQLELVRKCSFSILNNFDFLWKVIGKWKKNISLKKGHYGDFTNFHRRWISNTPVFLLILDCLVVCVLCLTEHTNASYCAGLPHHTVGNSDLEDRYILSLGIWPNEENGGLNSWAEILDEYGICHSKNFSYAAIQINGFVINVQKLLEGLWGDVPIQTQ